MNTKSDMRSYFDQYLMVSILIPKNWTIDWIEKTKFRLFSNPEISHRNYNSTISYTFGRPQEYSRQWFDSLVKQSGKEMPIDYNKYCLSKEDYFEIDSHLAYHRYFTWHDNESELFFSQSQTFILCNQSSMYMINTSTLKEIEEKYNPIFDSIINSTRILIPERT